MSGCPAPSCSFHSSSAGPRMRSPASSADWTERNWPGPPATGAKASPPPTGTCACGGMMRGREGQRMSRWKVKIKKKVGTHRGSGVGISDRRARGTHRASAHDLVELLRAPERLLRWTLRVVRVHVDVHPFVRRAGRGGGSVLLVRLPVALTLLRRSLLLSFILAIQRLVRRGRLGEKLREGQLRRWIDGSRVFSGSGSRERGSGMGARCE